MESVVGHSLQNLVDGIAEPLSQLYASTAMAGRTTEVLVLTDGEHCQSNGKFDREELVQLLQQQPPVGSLHVQLVAVGTAPGRNYLEDLARGVANVDVVGVEEAAGSIQAVFKTFTARVQDGWMAAEDR